ncbi:putative flippase GtrA [Novosphingobium sp. PhB165]|uniref:GtrA family protein n=1 Tax=Novosphingobium sp. PhB165 TaxID=2485105 RepID=UPI0010DE4032|nr:GtrA family protein [Novosphingobium sp. PhB165]TCM21353.1 putative flippase GtrA [Novosphingobium sp. PhB165]
MSPADRAVALRGELATLARFVLVGAANTAIGYGLILCWLFAGLGDYGANVLGFAMGLPISYLMHRSLTFRARHRPSRAEIVRYVLAFLTAYGANLGVIALGRAAGLGGSALLQALAVCTYAALLFVLTRLIVFPARRA